MFALNAYGNVENAPLFKSDLLGLLSYETIYEYSVTQCSFMLEMATGANLEVNLQKKIEKIVEKNLKESIETRKILGDGISEKIVDSLDAWQKGIRIGKTAAFCMWSSGSYLRSWSIFVSLSFHVKTCEEEKRWDKTFRQKRSDLMICVWSPAGQQQIAESIVEGTKCLIEEILKEIENSRP